VPWYELRLSAWFGFAPDIRREDVLAIADDGGVFHLTSGSIAPAAMESHAGRAASRGALRAIAVLAANDLATAGRMRLDPAVRAEVEDLVDNYVQYHVEYALPDRVQRVAGQIEGGLASASQTRGNPG